MERKDSLKPRRPLPNPVAITQDNAHAVSSSISTQSASAFYSSTDPATSPPPPLPSRPKPPGSGSGHTLYRPPTPAPPTYVSDRSAPFREPELVIDDGAVATQIEPAYDWRQVDSDNTSDWQANAWPDQPVNGWKGTWGAGATELPDYQTSFQSTIVPKIEIDGRSEDEELQWWNPDVINKAGRPGHGMVPPMVAKQLGYANSLLHVTASYPDIKPSATRGPRPAGPGPDKPPPSSPAVGTSASAETSSISSSTSSSSSPAFVPPTADEVRTAVPHAHTYFSRKHNGWALLIYKSSSILPPFAKSFKQDYPLPDQTRRKQVASCVGDSDWREGQKNRTHHFHAYPRAIDSRCLNPPFRRSEWEKVGKVKQRRRKITFNMPKLSSGEIDFSGAAEDMDVDEEDSDDEGDLLDLYVCCQCQVSCVCSQEIMPAVLPSKFVEEFTQDKAAHPSPGRTPAASVVTAWETINKIIENKLWKGESRPLRVTQASFQSKVGWTPTVRVFLETLGFVVTESDGASKETQAIPPSTDPSTSIGKQNRVKLLRAWVEIGAWLQDYQRTFEHDLEGFKPLPLWVTSDPVRNSFLAGIGAHEDQLPRLSVPMSLQFVSQAAWKDLGLPMKVYSSELLVFAYMAQCRCAPQDTPNFYNALVEIVNILEVHGPEPPTALLQLVIHERESRYRYTYSDLTEAKQELGFGSHLGVELEEVEDDFIISAWKDIINRSYRNPDSSSGVERRANQALRIVAAERRSAKLMTVWEDYVNNPKAMNPDRAFATLEVPRDVDEEMLLTVYSFRVTEQPSQDERMREAMSVIAEVRDSERLRQFLKTGVDPGVITAPIAHELPRGLNQLGNTCYLNSLLQYFYTIKELRDAIVPLVNLDDKADNHKLSDDDLKMHRVGGRLITRREIARSRKFISQLASLFWDMEHSDRAAVTPTIQLAKLALTTSKDEEEDEADSRGTESSNDTDATLVEDGPLRPQSARTPLSPTRSSDSVLGKRGRDGEVGGSASLMLVDSPSQETPERAKPIVTTPRSPTAEHNPGAASSSSKAYDRDADITITKPELGPVAKPSSPRRGSESVMMFGRQHDVAECMDNCMFQIETALLKFDHLSADGDDKTSVVKRLFYGKIRQRISKVLSLDASIGHRRGQPSTHEKEDLFSHLPVNVTDAGIDIYDGLSRYFDDVVDFDGKKARMEVSLVDLPPILQIQLQRVQFNRETLQPYKSQAYVKFGDTIYMDRFLDSSDPVKRVRSKDVQTELSSCRERLRLIVSSNHAPFGISLATTANYLGKEDGPIPPELATGLMEILTDEQIFLDKEIASLKSRITTLKGELETIWAEEHQCAYELTSVFIHRGSSPSWGHYFFYSRHLPEQPDSWFKYNDSEVTAVSKDEIFADTTGSTANPYLLVFARKGSEVIDTVNRIEPMLVDNVNP